MKNFFCTLIACIILCFICSFNVFAQDNTLRLIDFSFLEKDISLDEVYEKVGTPVKTSDNCIFYNIESMMTLEIYFNELNCVSDIAIVFKEGLRMYADFTYFDNAIGIKGNNLRFIDEYNKKNPRSIASFAYIQPEMSIDEITEKSGQPDTYAGFGDSWPVYKLHDGNSLHLHFWNKGALMYISLQTESGSICVRFSEETLNSKVLDFKDVHLFDDLTSIQNDMQIEQIIDSVNLPHKRHVQSISFKMPDDSKMVIYITHNNAVKKIMLKTKDNVHMFVKSPFSVSQKYDSFCFIESEYYNVINAKENSTRELENFIYVTHYMEKKAIIETFGDADFEIGNALFYYLSDGNIIRIAIEEEKTSDVSYINNAGYLFSLEFDENGDLLLF